MSHVSPEGVASFKKIFKEEYGIDYTDAEAYEAACNLVGFFEVLHEIHQRLEKEKGQENSELCSGVKL